MKKIVLILYLILPMVLIGCSADSPVVSTAKEECSKALSTALEDNETFQSFSELKLAYKAENDSLLIFNTDVVTKINDATEATSKMEVVYLLLSGEAPIIALNTGLDFGSLVEKTQEFKTELSNDAPGAFANFTLDDCYKLVVGQLLLHDKLKPINNR